MPIRPEYKKYYGTPWRKYRLVLLEIARYQCRQCGQNHKYLGGAHLDHDPANGTHVEILCPSCHSRHDSHQRYAMTRRTKAKRSGQLWLSSEIEFAPYPSRLWPRRVVRDAQLDLFDGDPLLP